MSNWRQLRPVFEQLNSTELKDKMSQLANRPTNPASLFFILTFRSCSFVLLVPPLINGGILDLCVCVCDASGDEMTFLPFSSWSYCCLSKHLFTYSLTHPPVDAVDRRSFFFSFLVREPGNECMLRYHNVPLIEFTNISLFLYLSHFSRKNAVILRTQLSVRVHAIIGKCSLLFFVLWFSDSSPSPVVLMFACTIYYMSSSLADSVTDGLYIY